MLAFALALLPQVAATQEQNPDADATALIQRVDATNRTRYDNVLEFTDTEHYAVFRDNDESHPAAEMVVKMTYRKGMGKSYEIVSKSGSQIIQKFGLEPLLQSEKDINDPAKVQQSWFSSANYDMRPIPGQTRQIDGRTCVTLRITPRRKAPNMVDGTLWVDPRDGTIAQVEGVASKSPNPFAGTTHMMRLYTNIKGYSMAVHARAESSSPLVGHTIVTIDYTDYQLKIRQ